MRSLTKSEMALIHPHKVYKFKCGMNVWFANEVHMFLGYSENLFAVIADKHGNRKRVEVFRLSA